MRIKPVIAGLCLCVLSIAALAAQTTPIPLRYAKAFSIEQGRGYLIARVSKPWNGASFGFSYVFYPRGEKPPKISEPGARFVQTPIRSAVSFSASYLAAIEALGKLDSLIGLDSAAYAYSSAARARIDSGAMKEVMANWAPNVELLISMNPDAVFAYGMGNEWDIHPKLSEAGLPVIICAEWMENDPLGRAEWLKFFALFYGESAKAYESFARIEREYLAVKADAAKTIKSGAQAQAKPRVLVNAPFQGSWSVSGGQSYMARLIADAAGDYLWKDDTSSGGIVLSLEAVFERASTADIWLSPGTAASLQELFAQDSRFSALGVSQSGAVWNNTLRSLPSGANDYFESAVYKPQELLADIAAIIHPRAFPERVFSYFQKLR